MTYTAAYHFDQPTIVDPLTGICTVESIEAGHAWLIDQLLTRRFVKANGFAEVIDTVDDRTVLHHSGSLTEVMTELTICTCRECVQQAAEIETYR
jgi:hypothetical protein